MKSSGYAFAWIEWNEYWRRRLRLRLAQAVTAIGNGCLRLAEWLTAPEDDDPFASVPVPHAGRRVHARIVSRTAATALSIDSDPVEHFTREVL